MNDKQQIAFICHPYHRGGVTRWMADAAVAFAKTGLSVYFITVDPVKEFISAKGRETLLQLLSKEECAMQVIKTRAGYEFEFGTAEYRVYVYKKLIAQLPAGIPVMLSDDVSIWAAAASLHTSYQVIGVLHADENHYYDLAVKYEGQVAALVCVSDRINKNARGRIPGFDPSRMYTIPCGINLAATNFSSSDGPLQLVYVGRISEYQKRAGDLVSICALLAKLQQSFHLNIIGDGDARTSLENKFKEDGLQQYVTFCGWLSQNNVHQRLLQSDVLVLTSSFEGMPIAMMEALAAGCGVAGTRVSGIEDYEHYPMAANCLSVFAVGDMEDAVNKINKVAAIPKNIRQQAARKMAESEFSMQVCLEKYLSVIAAIKSSPGPPPGDIRLSPFKRLCSQLLAMARRVKVEVGRKL